jgi:hypothetical protein
MIQALKRSPVVVGLVLLVIVEVFSLSLTASNQSGTGVVSTQIENGESVLVAPILKLSEIRGPQIDSEAATIVVTASPICFALPVNIWILLLLAYVVLLIFNFSYTFERVTSPQWFFEVGLTALAIIAWYAWDTCQSNLWFPFAAVKLGLLVFVLYAYLLEKKLLEKRENEKTESLF